MGEIDYSGRFGKTGCVNNQPRPPCSITRLEAVGKLESRSVPRTNLFVEPRCHGQTRLSEAVRELVLFWVPRTNSFVRVVCSLTIECSPGQENPRIQQGFPLAEFPDTLKLVG